MASTSSLVPLEVESAPAAPRGGGPLPRALGLVGVACALCGLATWIYSEPVAHQVPTWTALQHLPGMVRRPVQQFPRPLQPYLPVATPRGAPLVMMDDADSPPSPAGPPGQPVEPAVAPSSLRSTTKTKKQKTKQPKQKVSAPTPKGGAAVPEVTGFEGAPSATEMIIPGLSILTVVGIIPFAASVARQAWTRYKFTNRRIEVASGFMGNDLVQVTYKEIVDVKWLRRFGGSAGDLVLTLRDGAKLEMRSVPEFDRNLAYIMEQLGEDLQKDVGYPDAPARDFIDKIKSGEEPPLTAPAPDAGATAVAGGGGGGSDLINSQLKTRVEALNAEAWRSSLERIEDTDVG